MKAFMGSGVGRTVILELDRGDDIVESVEKTLEKEGITRCCLNVMETNEQGKAFWLKKGWEKKDFLGFYSKAITNKENHPLFKV